MVFRSGNPALRPEQFQPGMGVERMSIEGTISKTLALLGLVTISALVAYTAVAANNFWALPLMIGGGIGGFIMVLVIAFSRPAQPQILMSIYAILEGLFVGAMSYVVENWYQGETSGVVLQAIVATMAVFILMLTLYRYRVIQPTEKFVLAVVSVAGAIMLVYLLNFVMFLFGSEIPFLHSDGPIGVVISVVFCAVAALFLIIDFGVIENGVKNGAPKNMEWYGAFGLVITLVWLYIEMLKLIAKLRSD